MISLYYKRKAVFDIGYSTGRTRGHLVAILSFDCILHFRNFWKARNLRSAGLLAALVH